MEYKIVTFRISEAVVNALDRIAEEHDRSRNKVVENLLKRGLDAYRSDGVLVTRNPVPTALPPPRINEATRAGARAVIEERAKRRK